METNEIITNTQEIPNEPMTQDYLAAIKQLKSTSVDKSTYDALMEENKKLLNAYVNGQKSEQEPEKPQVPSADDIKRMRTELFNPENEYSNLEYVSRALELRNALILNGQCDPFIPVGKQISPTREDIEIAEKVASVYRDCIDYAQGDSEAFTNELMRRTKDVGRLR